MPGRVAFPLEGTRPTRRIAVRLEEEVPILASENTKLLHAFVNVKILAPEAKVQPARPLYALLPSRAVGVHSRPREDLNRSVQAEAVALCAVHDVHAPGWIVEAEQRSAGSAGEEHGVRIQLHRPVMVPILSLLQNFFPYVDENPGVQACHEGAAHVARRVHVDRRGGDAWSDVLALVREDRARVARVHPHLVFVLQLGELLLPRRDDESKAVHRPGPLWHGRDLICPSSAHFDAH
mmetsp:Transcript_30270/g.68755  ORF Transcript_30270/g.68755 Transcript_30270/m.68755 type:complete len:236 (-) Transcript_30270:322-1029(-)